MTDEGTRADQAAPSAADWGELGYRLAGMGGYEVTAHDDALGTVQVGYAKELVLVRWHVEDGGRRWAWTMLLYVGIARAPTPTRVVRRLGLGANEEVAVEDPESAAWSAPLFACLCGVAGQIDSPFRRGHDWRWKPTAPGSRDG